MLIRDESYERLRMCVVAMIREQIIEYEDILEDHSRLGVTPNWVVDALEELEMCMDFNTELVRILDESAPPELRDEFGTKEWRPRDDA